MVVAQPQLQMSPKTDQEETEMETAEASLFSTFGSCPVFTLRSKVIDFNIQAYPFLATRWLSMEKHCFIFFLPNAK